MPKKNYKRSSKSKTKKLKQSSSGVYILISIFIAFIMMLSLYIDSDAIVLSATKNTLQMFFGIGGYILPAAIITMVLLFHFNYENHKRNMIAAIVIFVFLLVILDVNLLYGEDMNLGFSERIKSSIEIGRTGFGGGLVGGIFSYLLIKLIGKEATVLLSVFTILISSIIIANRSLFEIIKSLIDFVTRIPIILGNIIGYIKTYFKKANKRIEERKEIKKLERARYLDQLKKEERKRKIFEEEKNKNTSLPKEPLIINGEDGQFEFEIAGVNDNNDSKAPRSREEIKQPSEPSVKNIVSSEHSKQYEAENIEIKRYNIPPIDLLSDEIDLAKDDKKHIVKNAEKLVKTLADFGIDASIDSANMGPSITKYEIQIAPGVKVSRILNLSNDLALSLASSDIRIEAPIPGKSAIGIEIPNKHRTNVRLREIIETEEFRNFKGSLPIALGKDVEGKPIIADIEKAPHMLIAGATGSGKSVCINTIITSIIYKSSPDEVKLILIDPKVVELSIYNGIPHLYIPVVTNPNKAAGALNWAVSEMNKRYEMFANEGVRDINGFNKKSKNKLPKLVMIIDELSDLMMTTSSNEVEELICRIAQMARAAGIHLIIATQRPSVDVITGTIKANIPTRISFSVSSQTDSRTILDMAGAEKLLGRGDMLYSAQNMSKPMRIQGAYIDDEEVERLVSYLKQNNEVDYEEEMIERIEKEVEYSNDDCDELLSDAIELVINDQQASTSYLQRRLKIGYSRAARIMDQMEERGIIGPAEGNRGRKVLISKEDIEKAEEYDERG